MGGGGSKTTTNTVAEPPKFLQPYLQNAANESTNLFYQGGREYYPNSTVVPFSPQTQQALGLIQNRAMTGGAATNAAQGYTQDTLGGAGVRSNPFIGGQQNPFTGDQNPYLDRTFNRAADSVQQRLQGSFAGSGRDIQAARPVAAQELNDLATGIYGTSYENDAARRFQGYENDTNRRFQAYADERKRQDFAAGLAPTLDATDYQDLSALEGVGSRYEDLYGRQLQDDINRFDYYQNLPYQNLDEYIARIQGAYPGQGQSSSSQGPGPNRAAGALGGGLAGAQIGSQIYPGVGTAIGAGVGALGGYFLS